MTSYTVIHTCTGEAIASGLTLEGAADEILNSDGREYDIRPSEDGNGFELWARQQVANKGWTRTVIYSLEDGRLAAELEILTKVIAANWARHPIAMTDAEFAAMTSELS
jgi:hypothetical protein